MADRISHVDIEAGAHVVPTGPVLNATSESDVGGYVADLEEARRIRRDIGGVMESWTDTRHEDSVERRALAMHEYPEHMLPNPSVDKIA
jgi:hypothetical protein